MHKNVDVLFENLWENYLAVAPSAKEINELLDSGQDENLVNDHIVLRTFNLEKVGIEKLASHFKAVGYKEAGVYHFEDKKLFAKHYEHSDPSKPKVFISELLVEKLSTEVQTIIFDLVAQMDESEI